MGQRKCSVSGCKSASHLPECGELKFHTFASNEAVRNVWIKNCHIPQNRSITKNNVVCSRHFLDSDYYQASKNGRRFLTAHAVPTIFAWGIEKSFAEQFEDAQNSSPTSDASTKDIICKTTSGNTSVGKTKKMISRSQANIASAKQSTEDQSTSDTNIKINQAKKTLNTATLPEQPAVKENILKSPSKRFDIAMQLKPGAKVEVQDLAGSWHNASVTEVDQGENEVLINFEKNVRSKSPSGFKLNDEWIAMDSSRLRIPIQMQFKAGDRCLARWTDSRKFPATVIKPLENNKYEVLFDDGLAKHVKGIHMSKIKRTANEKQSELIDSSATAPPLGPIPPVQVAIPSVQSTIKKQFKIHPIPKFDLSEFHLPEIPEGEWCCPWINDTPIGDEGFLLNADGTKRPTVLVKDSRLPDGWKKHLYQRSRTSLKWDVVLIGPNNKRFRSKSDVKVYLEEIGQKYDSDIFDFSVHKRRAKDVGVYVFSDDYVPMDIKNPAYDFKLDSSLDLSIQDTKSEPFTGFSPNESTSSILSKIGQEMKAKTSTPIKTEANVLTFGPMEEGFIYVGGLKVQLLDNLFQCPKEECKKSFRKENHLQIHVKHYHSELSQQLGACPNMTQLAYIRTMGTSIDESSPKNQIPNAQFFEKSFASEMRTVRKSQSPTRLIKTDPHTDEQSIPLPVIVEKQESDGIKRKLSTHQMSPEVKEKRKPSVTDKVDSPETALKIEENVVINDMAENPMTSTPLKKDGENVVNSKAPTKKKIVHRFKIGPTAKLNTKKISQRKCKTLKRKFKKLGKSFKRKNFANRMPTLHRGQPRFAGITSQPEPQPQPSRLKFLQFSSIDPNAENSAMAMNVEQRSASEYINENGKHIKIVRMPREEVINCLCSYTLEDGLMIQCELCLCWQHGGCNGIENECQVPEKYVCSICKNPERARESMRYIHDQEWLYEGKLFHANYHQSSHQATFRSDILKQSHMLTGNLLELKRSLHCLNVKINIAANKDHPKMYLWSKKWEQNSLRNVKPIALTKLAKVAVEPVKKAVEQLQATPDSENKEQIVGNLGPNKQEEIADADEKNAQNESKSTKKLDAPNEFETKQEIEKTSAENIIVEKVRTEMIARHQLTQQQAVEAKNDVQSTPVIPKPEKAIDPLECQHRLFEHIQKEQNTFLSRMKTIEAQIIALESMDDNPETNSNATADFARTSRIIKMLLQDLAKMKKLADINEQTTMYNSVEPFQYAWN